MLTSEDIAIENLVLQGDTLSSTLFIIGLDRIIRLLPTQIKRKLLLDTLAYADDLAMIYSCLFEAMRKIVNLPETSKGAGLQVSISKLRSCT